MSFNDEKDDFWDIDKLLPKKRHSILTPFSTKEKLSTVEIASREDTNAEEKPTTSLSVPANEAKGDRVKYEFTDSLVRSVTVVKMHDKYDFYGNFRKAALLYYDVPGSKCEFVPFFSYMPQYSQLNAEQSDYYFYWRDMIRRDKFIKTDYSYLYLFIYEILNLPDRIPAADGLDLLIKLWREYRKELPNIDSQMSLWLQDYCFVHDLKCPMDKIKDFIFDIISVAEFKEFYLCDIGKVGNDGVGAMVAYLSDYDWRKGKFAGGEHRDAYETHILGAMRLLIGELWRSGELFSTEDFDSAVLKRSAFRGSLCTHSVKCKLEIEYLPLSKADTLKRAVTAALKYTENKLRAQMGIKSRLLIKDLPDTYRAVIDRYFTSLFDKANKQHIRARMPEYEKLYDAAESGFSAGGADEIERASWTTTLRLVENSDDEIVVVEEAAPEETPAHEENTLSPDALEYLRAAFGYDTDAMRAVTDRLGISDEELIEEINLALNIGDNVLEMVDGECVPVEDYREDISKWLTK